MNQFVAAYLLPPVSPSLRPNGCPQEERVSESPSERLLLSGQCLIHDPVSHPRRASSLHPVGDDAFLGSDPSSRDHSQDVKENDAP